MRRQMVAVQEAWAGEAVLVLALTGLVVISQPGDRLTVKATPMTVAVSQPMSRSGALVRHWASAH